MSNSKKFTIGILGAGQLALYLLESFLKEKQNDESIVVFYQNVDDPVYVFHKKYCKRLPTEEKKLIESLNECQTVLLENEFIPYETLKKCQTQFVPEIESYKNFYGKVSQRLFYQKLGLNSPNFKIIYDIAELENISFFPVILKKDLFSYDGKGNREANNFYELHQYSAELGLPLLVEEKLSIHREFALGILISPEIFYPFKIFETIQKNHICHLVLGPITDRSVEEKINIEIEKLKKFPFSGFYTFEFFELQDGRIIINEGAARPHNSQHITMNLFNHSQFDLIIKMALKRPISPLECKAREGAMINLLGKKNTQNPVLSLPNMNQLNYQVYLYGKKDGKIGRKLGHINFLNNDMDSSKFINAVDAIYEGYEL